jgi:hypothetical protein
MRELLDICFITYIATSVVCLYGFFLFFMWLKSVEHKEIYVYVMMLLGSIFLYSSCNGYARYIYLSDHGTSHAYDAVVASWFWEIRAIPSFLFVTAIVWRMTRRALKTVRDSKAGQAHLHRRATDK